MMERTKHILHSNIDFLPLTTNVNIVEGNALRMDWENVIPSHKLNYIMGNPPFVGANNVNKEQKQELIDLFGKGAKAGIIDYVCGWYIKAATYIENSTAHVAFVSTNSITQGEQVSILWGQLFDRGIIIDFAYKSFIWDSEASIKAHVHCVIIGFSKDGSKTKRIFNDDSCVVVSNISPYLIPGANTLIERANKPICDVPHMEKGNQPTDGGNLIINEAEYDAFIADEPNAKQYIKRLYGAEEYINNKKRYCLWLVGVSPATIKSMPRVYKRVESCREDRLNGGPDKRKLADRPTEFRETKNPERYILIPSTSSENRRYIPIGFMTSNDISTNANLIIPDANMYHFGILTSNVHMAWMRTVAGRLKSDYRYSAKVVYNNFPWPSPTPDQKAKIEQTAQGILDARALYPDSSLADLYDELTMPPELRKAHQENDKAVMAAYGITKSDEEFHSESACVAMLMKMYKELIEKEK